MDFEIIVAKRTQNRAAVMRHEITTPLALITPDGKSDEGSMVVMAVGNNRFAGGSFKVTPKAKLQDGLLDLAMISSVNPGDVKAIAAELEDPFNKDNRFLLYRQLESFIIEADKPLHVNLDGEQYVDRRFEFSIRPKALNVVLGDALSD